MILSLPLFILIGLTDISEKVNKDLPIIYDHATKLMKTSVENDQFVYHYIIGGTQEEYDLALPMVKSRILKSVCTDPVTRDVLNQNKKTLIYRYENHQGLTLGQFMIEPKFCKESKI